MGSTNRDERTALGYTFSKLALLINSLIRTYGTPRLIERSSSPCCTILLMENFSLCGNPNIDNKKTTFFDTCFLKLNIFFYDIRQRFDCYATRCIHVGNKVGVILVLSNLEARIL